RIDEIRHAPTPAEPTYELKGGFPPPSSLAAEPVQAIRTRVGEMREPPLGLEAVPHEALQVFFDEILAAPTTEALILGVYEKAMPALDAALAEYVADVHPLCDAPSIRVCRFARMELADMMTFGLKCAECLIDDQTRRSLTAWADLLDRCLDAAGGLGGTP